MFFSLIFLSVIFSPIRLLNDIKSNCQVAKINQLCFSKYNIAFNTFMFSFDAKEMLLTKKYDFFHIRQIFGIRQNVADVSFLLLLSLKLHW